MIQHIQPPTDSGIGGKIQIFLETGTDIRLLGWLFIVSGIIDFFWILAYPDYALKVFGRTFSGWTGVSEIGTQIVEGYHPTRTTMIIISLLFEAYILARRNAFKPKVRFQHRSVDMDS